MWLVVKKRATQRHAETDNGTEYTDWARFIFSAVFPIHPRGKTEGPEYEHTAGAPACLSAVSFRELHICSGHLESHLLTRHALLQPLFLPLS